MKPEPRTYSTNELCAIAGITLRQAQMWDENGVIQSQMVRGCGGRSGNCRKFRRNQVVMACVVKALLDKGLSLQKITARLSGCAGPTCGYLVWGSGQIQIAKTTLMAVHIADTSSCQVAIVDLDQIERRIPK